MTNEPFRAVNEPGDDVINGSNFPTPMAMAPQSEEPDASSSDEGEDGAEE
jgi:hypothetical protein